MTSDDALYKEFLAEMETLEKFRISYSGLHPEAPLKRDDQDVRRMIEAMAMFSAKTRMTGKRGVMRSTMRLFSQHFPYLMNPMPMLSMLSAEPSQKFVDAADIPKGSRVFLSGEGRQDGPLNGEPLVAHFQTLSSLRVLPYSLEWVEIVRKPGVGFQLLLRVQSDFARNDEIGELNFHINHLNDFGSSSVIGYNLKKHTSSIGVVFDEDVTSDTEGESCEFYFGSPKVESDEATAFDHPLQRARAFFQFPQQDLFMNVQIPDQPRNWKYFTLMLELSGDWPTELRMGAGSFELNVAPVINLAKALSDPLIVDGTKERYLVSPADLQNRFVPQSVLAVYRLDGEGMVPIPPGVIDGDRACYELESEGELESRRVWSYLNIPDSFDNAVPVATDGFWHQPILSEEKLSDWEADLADRHVEGVDWSVSSTIIRPKENVFVGDYEGLMHLLSIKNQRFLGTGDLLFLLRALGASHSSDFNEIVNAVTNLEFESKPFVKNSTGFKYIYRLSIENLDVGLVGFLDLFGVRLLEILTAWSMEEVVELQVSVRNLELELNYR